MSFSAWRESYEKLKRSLAWDSLYNLPLVRLHNNPHLYCAYSIALLLSLLKPDEESCKDELHLSYVCWMDYFAYLDKCSPEGHAGFYHRWPDGRGGSTSHDEVIGIAWLGGPLIARAILSRLEEFDGDYKGPGQVEGRLGEFNLYRFLFLKPYLKACAGYRVSWFSQALWVLTTIAPDFFTDRSKLSAGSLLRNWLMSKRMETLPISGAAIRAWKSRMKALGVGPKWCLERYLSEIPELREIAQEEF